MMLYVLRHGIAEETAAGGDAARRLTAEGRTKMRAAVRGMQALAVRIEALLTSPYARAAETAGIVAAGYGAPLTPQTFPALEAGVPPVETLRALRPFARRDHVMIVGHEPGLSEFASLVLTGSAHGMAIDLKKGGLIAIELARVAPPGGAVLRWLATPRQLRRAGR